MNTLPWYKSQVIQAQIVQVITALLAASGIVLDVDINAAVGAIFIIIQIGAAAWAAHPAARLRRRLGRL